MSADLLLVREGSHLVAAEPGSAEIISNIKKNEIVCAVIRRPRNVRHLRKFFALMNVVFKNQSYYSTLNDLVRDVKISTGLFTTGKTIDGIPWVEPGSISFKSQDQHDFEQWYDKAIAVILTKILPGVNKFDLEEQVLEILNGNAREN